MLDRKKATRHGITVTETKRGRYDYYTGRHSPSVTTTRIVIVECDDPKTLAWMQRKLRGRYGKVEVVNYTLPRHSTLEPRVKKERKKRCVTE